MKVYVAAKPSGAVVGVYTSLVDSKKALNDVYFMGESQIKGLWVSPSGAVIQSFELEGISSSWPPDCLKDGVAVWDFNLEPERLRPKRDATVSVIINYEGLNLKAMVKETVDKALKREQEKIIHQLLALGGYNG